MKLLKIILMASLLANSAGFPPAASERESALRPAAFSLSSHKDTNALPKSSSAGKAAPEWPEKVWDAVNELGIEAEATQSAPVSAQKVHFNINSAVSAAA